MAARGKKQSAKRTTRRTAPQSTPSGPTFSGKRPIESRLTDALETMQDVARGQTSNQIRLQVKRPPIGRGITPWVTVGRFKFDRPVGYQQAHQIFAEWEDSNKIAKQIGNDRMARIQVRYTDGTFGSLAETSAWGYTVSDATTQTDQSFHGKVGNRYQAFNRQLEIDEIVVWLSATNTKGYTKVMIG